MAPRRVPNATKRLRGTYEKNKDTATYTGERVRLTEIVPPPANVDADVRHEWRLHMELLLLTGVAAPSDLRSFLALCQSAALCERSYQEARKSGPTVLGAEGNEKPAPAWTGWLAANAAYLRWARAFSLVPAAGLPALPMPRQGGKLEVVA
jgi:hypothetical protein